MEMDWSQCEHGMTWCHDIVTARRGRGSRQAAGVAPPRRAEASREIVCGIVVCTWARVRNEPDPNWNRVQLRACSSANGGMIGSGASWPVRPSVVIMAMMHPPGVLAGRPRKPPVGGGGSLRGGGVGCTQPTRGAARRSLGCIGAIPTGLFLPGHDGIIPAQFRSMKAS